MNTPSLETYTTKRFHGIAAHGNTPFDTTLGTQITDTLFQGATPTEISGVPAEFKNVLNLYPWEAYKVPEGVNVREVELYDADMASPELILELAQWVNDKQAEGPVLVHCQAGLNRSALVAALSLMLNGMTADEAIQTLRTKRSPAVLCNPYFEKWLREWKTKSS